MTDELRILIDPAARFRHIYVAGKSQLGKSTLLFWMALQDMIDGHGVAVIDPDGDLVEALMQHLPPERLNDVIYLNGVNKIPIAFLNHESPEEVEPLVADLVEILRRLDPSWGVRMDSILQWSGNTLLAAKDSTFLDIKEILASEARRSEFLKRVDNPKIHEYWREEFPKLGKNVETPISTRMTTFFLNPTLEAIFSEPNPELVISDITEGGKILLVNLAKLHKLSKNIFGSLIVSKITQAIFRREGITDKTKRRPFYLYVDEFQEFVTTGFQSALQHGGKYAMGLTLANHYPAQLGSDLMDNVRGIVSTYILFKMNADLAQPLASEILPYKTTELTHLERGQILYRPADGPPTLGETPLPPPRPTPEEIKNAAAVRQKTIDQYGPKHHANSAQIGSKRIVHTESSDTKKPVLSLEKDDDITPTGRPKNIPPHKD